MGVICTRWLLGLILALGAGAPIARAQCPAFDRSHAPWSALLARHVEGGRVDYSALGREGRGELDAYLESLSGVCARDYERWAPPERIAFWINAYNAFTVKLILDHYPIASIREIGWLPGAAFRRKFIPMRGLEGTRISLDRIEHGWLRSAFSEPRIHFALVCAARSCPELRGEAYRGGDLERQLEAQGRTFLRDPAKNRVDRARRILRLSSIFRWFRGDFEKGGGSLAGFVSRYLEAVPNELADYSIEFLDYDWSLNDRESGVR